MVEIQAGLALLLTSEGIFIVTLGVTIGFVVGVLPGFSGSNAAALALPFSVAMPLETGLLLMAAIYAGASYAGSIPAILVNVPGTAGAAATAIDGYPMTLKGRAGIAIGVARMSSAIGGLISIGLVLVLIGPLSRAALMFGSREMFLVALIGLLVIGSVIGDQVKRGVLSAMVGMLIAAMAASPLTAQVRWGMGFPELYESVPFVPALIGLFAFGQMFQLSRQHQLLDAGSDLAGALSTSGQGLKGAATEVLDGIKETLRFPKTLLRSSLIGLGIGVIPGAGTAVANFISYGAAKRASTNPGEFGKGASEGVVASEACDNAVTSGTMVPTLTLGIPGSGTAAIMLVAMHLQGVQIGPRVMVTHADVAFAVLLGLGLSSILILPIGTLLATPLTYVTRVPVRVLVPAILVLSTVGVFAVRNSVFDVWVALVFGVLGYGMISKGYPVVPLVLGLILGPLAESNFSRAMALGQNEITYFFGSVVTRTLWGLLFLFALLAALKAQRARKQRGTGGEGLDVEAAVEPKAAPKANN